MWYEQGVHNFYIEEYTVAIIGQQGLIVCGDIYACFLDHTRAVRHAVCLCEYSLYARWLGNTSAIDPSRPYRTPLVLPLHYNFTSARQLNPQRIRFTSIRAHSNKIGSHSKCSFLFVIASCANLQPSAKRANCSQNSKHGCCQFQ